MSQTIELPDKVYTKLVEVARESGTTPADWIAHHLPMDKKGNGQAKRPGPTAQQVASANDLLWKQAVSLGHATGLDNESIDADLARAYAGDKAETPKPAEQ